MVIPSESTLLARDVEREVLPYCQAQHVGFMPSYPLAGSLLTGTYRRGEPSPPGSRGATNPRVQQDRTAANCALLERLTTWAAARGRGLNALAQAWLLAPPQVCSVIAGVTSRD
jgi:1-deoxyxylulose-5-phosphate synthase